MIVVAIVGTLAALATYGVRRYVAMSKSAEAIQSLGGIGNAVVAASARESMSADILEAGTTAGIGGGKVVGSTSGKGKSGGGGATVTFSVPGLCGSSEAVPKQFNMVAGKKYQSTPAEWNTGDISTGWHCLRFNKQQAQYYQYRYKLGGPPITVRLPKGGAPPGIPLERQWSAYARGDLDGDGETSWFVMYGAVNNERQAFRGPAIGIADQDE